MATYTDNYNLVKPTMAETADIRTINGNMDSVDNIMHATQVSLAPAYDSSETYNTGDIVMYEFLMYECLDDDVTGTWDATKWQRTTAGEHGGGGGGSNVSITPTLQSGTKIADFEIDGVSGALYAPSGGGGGGGGNGNGKVDLVYRAVDTSFVDIAFDISKYDLYIINASDSLLHSGETYTVTREALKYYLDNSIAFCGWPYRGSSANALIQYLVTANGFEADDHALGFVITSIYGINTGTVLAPMIYSEDEREVGCWIDNKPLYAKTVSFVAPSGSGNHSIMDVSDLDIDSLANIEGKGSYQGYLYTFPTRSAFFAIEQDYLKFNVSDDDWGGYTMNITLYYTKTSDVAGSGSYGSLGVPMEHYDSTERVVGTYFGDTLYKKTIRQTNIDGSPSDWTLIETMSGVGEYVKSEASFKRGNMIFSQYYISIMFDNSTKGLYYFIREMGSGARCDFEVTVYYTKSTT